MNTENTNINMAADQPATPADSTGGQKTFTQEDVNRIVSDRLAKDRAKSSEEISKREQELAEREFRFNSRQKLLDRGYPESIMEALNCNSEKEFDKALDIIDELIKERTPSEEEKAEIEAMLKAAGSAPKFLDALSESGMTSGGDMIRKAMNL